MTTAFFVTRSVVWYSGTLCRLLPQRSVLLKASLEDELNRNLRHQQVRAFKSDLKIKWVRPVKIPCIDPRKSGDLKPREEINKEEPVLELQNSKELQECDESVKRIFSLEFSPKQMSADVVRMRMISSVNRHAQDFGSIEAKIAEMTSKIRCLQEAAVKFPRNRRQNVVLKELIDKRKKYLKYLRKWDYKKFEWLLAKLDLVYRPPPSHFHWVTRKESLVKLTDKYCEDLKVERLKSYREVLESQKVAFLTEKIKKLQWIMEEEAACGTEPTVSQNDIEKVVKQLEELKIQKGLNTQL